MLRWSSCQDVTRHLQCLLHQHAECCTTVLQVWARDYSAEDPERCDCDALQEALGMIQGARRMVCSPPVGCCPLPSAYEYRCLM